MQRLVGHACRDTIYSDFTVESDQQKMEKMVLESDRSIITQLNNRQLKKLEKLEILSSGFDSTPNH